MKINIFYFCLLNAWCIHEMYFYRMNNNIKINFIFFLFLCLLNKTLKMHECMRLWRCMDECSKSIWNYFFLRMHVCYLHGSTWIVDETLDENEYMIRETLDENKFYEICMNVWSHRWMYEWMNESRFPLWFFF